VEVRCVGASEFMTKAPAADRTLREDSGTDHTENRVVLCDAREGLLSSLMGSKPRAAKALSGEYDESNLIQFSTSATELMSLRARASFDFFIKLVDEMSALSKEVPGFQGTPVVKLGYRTDGAKDDSDREHMWFEFHGMSGNQIDATLLNQPFNIARLKEGDRRLHALDLLTDWSIFAPITPSNSRPLRFIRKNQDRLREALANV
jgi:hypothetical protein